MNPLQMLRNFVTALVILAAADALGADVPGAFAKSDVVAINDVIERCSAAFARKDYDELRGFMQTPFVTFPGDAKVYDTMDALIQRLRSQRESLDAQGYGHSEFGETRITALGPDRALVDKTLRRVKKDGTMLEERATIYLVSKSTGSWKICGSFGQALVHFGKVF